jgi:pimeloyl-ACP methyl ester carboxylesterase
MQRSAARPAASAWPGLRPSRVLARRLHLNFRKVEARDGADPSAPPLVLMHGLFGSLSNFGTLSRRFSARRAVLVPDLRNHGASPWSDDCSIESMADDVFELLDSAGAESAVLCGHSLGGKVAMAAALSQPHRVAALVVADIAPVAYDTANAAWRQNLTVLRMMLDMGAAELGSRAEADKALEAAGIPEVRTLPCVLRRVRPAAVADSRARYVHHRRGCVPSSCRTCCPTRGGGG